MTDEERAERRRADVNWPQNRKNLGGRSGKQSLSPHDSVVLWLFIARTGMNMTRTAALFHIRRHVCCRRFVTMTHYLRDFCRMEFPLLSAAKLKASIPPRFNKFAQEQGIETFVVHILDGFEKQFQCPSDDEVRSAFWSSYKHLYTVKWLLDLLSAGAFYWLSDGCPGSITDPAQIETSGFLDLLEEGIDAMVDKGFLIGELLERRGSICWMPPKMRHGQSRATSEESDDTSTIARLRIFVEHAVLRIKEWGWFSCQAALKISQVHLHNDVARIIAMLCNLRSPLISQ